MKFTRVFAFMALAGLAGSAFATNGYFSHGYGMKAKGMAGAATTNTDDAFGGANNPAAMAFAGNRLDLGVDLFSPRREASMSVPGVSVKSDSNYFLIPEFGYTHQMSNDLALGVTVVGNGGMNTNYPTNLYGGNGKLGIDLMQLIVAPTVAYKVAPNHSIGISPLLGYQRFKAEGLVNPNTGTPIPNAGYDDSFGYGVRVGYLGKITPTVTIGAAYASKMNFDEFSKYNWLFLENGDFDIPENYNLGASWQATSALRLALDYQRINYSGVKAVGAAPSAGGFGYDDVNVVKLGAEYKLNSAWTLRAGYSHTNNPIKGATATECGAGSVNCGEVTTNILAPAVIKDHATLGFTYTLASGNELTMAYMHAFENDVSGYNGNSGGTDTIRMYQDSLGVQYSWKM
ncbi:putative long-chain fatty acid transport protein [Thiobacillus denitrificans ATCC 25259]|uniref:Putative long-chain fatty acid transport protein n=1 Tax=Thiobacillus denitrificans (strain ATCC 25259 / T1) TaxID=292415 RepID=Q3SL87_THIDA|nr:outer membrane protein transport protein [Thiobacillus denitrificans]AAZ96529.1 putative long-chain fatty acid transport protein [Thiobacillus denitrificans ATCC 25259]